MKTTLLAIALAFTAGAALANSCPMDMKAIDAKLAMNPKLSEAAADLFANPRQTFFKVTLPLLMPGILSGVVLAFIISLTS